MATVQAGSIGHKTGVAIAFQSIVRRSTGELWAREALMRPIGGASPLDFFAALSQRDRYLLDEALREAAITTAQAHDYFESPISINILPGALGCPATCVTATLEVAERLEVPAGKLYLEFSELEQFSSLATMKAAVVACRAYGHKVACSPTFRMSAARQLG